MQNLQHVSQLFAGDNHCEAVGEGIATSIRRCQLVGQPASPPVSNLFVRSVQCKQRCIIARLEDWDWAEGQFLVERRVWEGCNQMCE